MADTKISALSSGTVAATDRIPAAVSPFGAGDNSYHTPTTLAAFAVLAPSGNGTVTTGATTTVVEYGNVVDHLTVLTCTAFAVGTAGNSVDKAIGASLYTFPAAAICVENASVKGIFTKPSVGTVTDGEVGLGSVVGVGAVDTIAEVGATSGDVMRGVATGSYVLGTTVFTGAAAPVTTGDVTTIATGGVKTVFLNVAASWPATADAVTFTGVVTIRWRAIS
jgi:hypothetical protein